jgi:hypothetical protein
MVTMSQIRGVITYHNDNGPPQKWDERHSSLCIVLLSQRSCLVSQRQIEGVLQSSIFILIDMTEQMVDMTEQTTNNKKLPNKYKRQSLVDSKKM